MSSSIPSVGRQSHEVYKLIEKIDPKIESLPEIWERAKTALASSEEVAEYAVILKEMNTKINELKKLAARVVNLSIPKPILEEDKEKGVVPLTDRKVTVGFVAITPSNKSFITHLYQAFTALEEKLQDPTRPVDMRAMSEREDIKSQGWDHKFIILWQAMGRNEPDRMKTALKEHGLMNEKDKIDRRIAAMVFVDITGTYESSRYYYLARDFGDTTCVSVQLNRFTEKLLNTDNTNASIETIKEIIYG